MDFEGFDSQALQLLSRLPEFSQAAYREAQPTLKRGLQVPARALIAQVAQKLDPTLVVASSSLSPLHTDLRFAAPGTPRYKDHLLLTTWSGADRKAGATLWIRIAADSLGFASGVAITPSSRAVWRERVAGRAGVALARAIERVLSAHPAKAEVAGGQLKRVPAPWDDTHPREALLRCQGFQLRYTVPLPKSVADRSLVAEATARLKELMPVHNWLVQNVVA